MILRVQIENGRRAESFPVNTEHGTPDAIAHRLRVWLVSAVQQAGVSGVCRSFVVSVHVTDANCDHEVPNG